MNNFEEVLAATYIDVLLDLLAQEKERADRNYDVAKFFEQQYLMLALETGKISPNQAREYLDLPSLGQEIDD